MQSACTTSVCVTYSFFRWSETENTINYKQQTNNNDNVIIYKIIVINVDQCIGHLCINIIFFDDELTTRNFLLLFILFYFVLFDRGKKMQKFIFYVTYFLFTY